MPKMTDAEAQKYAMENGTHRLMGAVIQSKPCGCTVDGAGNLPSPVRVEFCALHLNAEKLLKALDTAANECANASEDTIERLKDLAQGWARIVGKCEGR